MTAPKPYPSREEIQQLFAYDPAGHLVWRVSVGGVKAGRRAGHRVSQGYIQVRIRGQAFYAHRLIWILHGNGVPDHLVLDHINRDKADNRIENLRLLTQRENTTNYIDGPLPVGIQEYRGAKGTRYKAYAKRGARRSYLGSFARLEEAVHAREAFIGTAAPSANFI